MTISKRALQSFDRLVANDPEGALFQICAAIEETAKREGRPKGKKGYKAWVADNIPIITAIGIGPALAGIRIAYSHPELPATLDGAHGFEDIVYHVVRCGLYHAASLPTDVHITENQIGADSTGALLIPKHLVTGLVVAVIASPSNAGETSSSRHFFEVSGVRFDLDSQWGRRDDLLKELMAARSSMPTP